MLKETCILETLPITNIFRANKFWGPYPKKYHIGRYANKVNEDDGYVDDTEKAENNNDNNADNQSKISVSRNSSRKSKNSSSIKEVVHENINANQKSENAVEILVENTDQEQQQASENKISNNEQIKPLPVESVDSVMDELDGGDEEIQIVEEEVYNPKIVN